MKKLILLLISLTLLGCSHTQVKKITLTENVTLDYFYVEGCGGCQSFEKNTIPALQETFGNKITVNEYDLDDEINTELYDTLIDSLNGFDEALYGQGPFICLEGYFAIIGFESSDTEYLIEDIVSATKGEPLSDELEERRYPYL